MCVHLCFCLGDSHVFMVELHDFVHQGHLVRDVVGVKQMLSTLSFLKIPNLS